MTNEQNRQSGVRRIITHEFPLDEINNALELGLPIRGTRPPEYREKLNKWNVHAMRAMHGFLGDNLQNTPFSISPVKWARHDDAVFAATVAFWCGR